MVLIISKTSYNTKENARVAIGPLFIYTGFMEKKTVHHTHTHKTFILRDHLAASRTIMASERTLLSYIRTSLTMIVVGVSLMKFFDSTIIRIAGWMFVPSGVGIFIIGFTRHKYIKNLILKSEDNFNFQEHALRHQMEEEVKAEGVVPNGTSARGES